MTGFLANSTDILSDVIDINIESLDHLIQSGGFHS